MWLFIIACIAFLVSCGGVIVIAMRKFSILSSLNIRDVNELREVKVKAAILERRLRSDVSMFMARVREYIVPFSLWVRGRYQSIKAWAVALEARYQQTLAEERARIAPEAAKITPDAMLGEAAALMEKDNMVEAEELLLKVIGIVPKSIAAFKLLARLYGIKREFDHVREVDEFLLKIDVHQADVYADLGNALVALGEPVLALDAYEKAVALEEGNPKYLDQLIDLSVLLKRRGLAEETLQLLEETNPENEKIPVFAQRIRALPKNE